MAAAPARPNLPVGTCMGILISGAPNKLPSNRMELFLDPQCPFSRKAYRTLRTLPANLDVHVIVNLYIQPWHGFSHFLTKAVLAVQLQGNDKALMFLDALYENQDTFADDDSKTPADYYSALEPLVEAAGADTAKFRAEVSSAIGHSGESTRNMKFLTRYGRQNGIHSTPTFLVNGLEYGAASSSWNVDQWVELFASLR